MAWMNETYQKLWQAVIEQALYDSTWKKKAHPEYMREARTWFFSPLHEDDFLHVCALAGRSPLKLKEYLNDLLLRNVPYRRRHDKISSC